MHLLLRSKLKQNELLLLSNLLFHLMSCLCLELRFSYISNDSFVLIVGIKEQALDGTVMTTGPISSSVTLRWVCNPIVVEFH